MKVDELVAVSGVGMLQKIVANKPNGLILEDIDSGKTKFYSLRKHQFTPIATVAIYTLEDTTPLIDVFKIMRDKEASLPVPAANSDKMVLLEYFENILPDYDEDRVYVSDIKKVVKWYGFLKERDLLKVLDEEDASSEEE